MRLCRYAVGDDVRFGLVEGPPGTPAADLLDPDAALDELVVTALDGHPFAPFGLTGDRRPLREVRLLAPVLPSKVVCIGKNYADHAREMGGEPPADPVVFLKPSTSVVGPGDPVQHPRDSERVDYEGELALVVSRLCREVPRARARDVVLGVTVANDVTARDQQAHDGQWTRGKGHDTFCPIGPWVETEADWSDLRLTTRLDGEVKQDSRTSLLLHDVPAVIEWITSFMTLLPGDVVLTGTPAGIGPMRPGQVVEVALEGVGVLRNPVVARG